MEKKESRSEKRRDGQIKKEADGVTEGCGGDHREVNKDRQEERTTEKKKTGKHS